MDNPVSNNTEDTITTSLTERIQECLQKYPHWKDYVTAVKLALGEGERELALKFVQEGIQYHEARAAGSRDSGTLGFLVPLCELVGDYRRAQEYCEKLHMYEKGGDLALKLGEPNEARRWWLRQIEYNESQNLGIYKNRNILLAKKMGDEDRAQELYQKLVDGIKKEGPGSFGDGKIAEAMGDTELAVRWYERAGQLGNAASVAFESDLPGYRNNKAYRIMGKIVENYDELKTFKKASEFSYLKSLEKSDYIEQVEVSAEFWKMLLAAVTSYYRNQGWSGGSFFAKQDSSAYNKYITLKRLQAQPETFIPPGKANVYLTLDKWLEEKGDKE